MLGYRLKSWKKLDAMCKVKSVDQFLKIVFEKIFEANIKKDDDPFNLFWFRGESCYYNETSLVPSAYRDLVVKNNAAIKEKKYSVTGKDHTFSYVEQNIRADFDRRALPYILSKNIESTAWNRYFLMQHYNVNTRLLDWTEDAIKALFFAVKIEAVKENTEDTKDADAKVWILQPFELNHFTFNKLSDYKFQNYLIPPLSNDNDKPQNLLYEDKTIRLIELTRRYLIMDSEEVKSKDYYPLAIYPPFLDERMAAQKACFTIFGNKCDGLREVIKLQNSLSPKIIDSIVIDGKSKKKIRSQLRLIGIDDSSIYPDLDGLGNALKSKYKGEYKNIEISDEKW